MFKSNIVLSNVDDTEYNKEMIDMFNILYINAIARDNLNVENRSWTIQYKHMSFVVNIEVWLLIHFIIARLIDVLFYYISVTYLLYSS
jgi:hypothetical protein